MPLLHQDNSRGGGGSNENRRSIAEFLGLDTLLPDSSTSDPPRNNDCGSENDWSWDSPSSPEVAQSPRALVPANCFPPRHPRAYTSFSESAQPGALWSDEPPASPQGITDLVASLKALAMSPPGPGFNSTSLPPIPYGRNGPDNGNDVPWSPEQSSAPLHRDEKRAKMSNRRDSFYGTVSGGGNRPLVWTGSLPARNTDITAEFSPKLFLGGLPWDISEDSLMYALRHFNPVRVEWPGADGSPRGFAYVTLESGRRVRALLAACRRQDNAWFYRMHSRKRQPKDVEVIPWAVADANWVSGGSARLAAARTVFVGALHGMLSAHSLAIVMNEVFAGVVYAGIDTDKNKYPIGSGRVTFDNVHSYVRAISAAYIEINTAKFSKKVQVDPYLEDSMCSVCNLQQGPYFCREPTCFGYFCRSCWSCQHPSEEHKPLMRNSKAAPTPALLVSAQHNGHALTVSAYNGHVTAQHNGHAPTVSAQHNGHAPAVSTQLNGHVSALHNGHGPRHSPHQDYGFYNGVYAGPSSEGTPSPSTSGTSASSAEAEGGAEPDSGWCH